MLLFLRLVSCNSSMSKIRFFLIVMALLAGGQAQAFNEDCSPGTSFEQMNSFACV